MNHNVYYTPNDCVFWRSDPYYRAIEIVLSTELGVNFFQTCELNNIIVGPGSSINGQRRNEETRWLLYQCRIKVKFESGYKNICHFI